MRFAMSLVVAVAGAAFAAPVPAAAQTRTHVIVVAGIGGEAQYTRTYYEWGTRLADVAVQRWGVEPGDVTFLAEKPEMDAARIDGRSTRDEIDAALRAVAARAGAADQVFITLIGHGSYQSGEGRFSLPGPDITGADLAVMLRRLGDRRVIVANTSSASGDFLAPLAAPNRIVITSTKSGMERNEARFAGFFIDAFAEDGADTDKDGAVSMLEAFEFARLEVGKAYERDSQLLTEHAVLDDNGDGRGSDEPGADKEDGRLAAATFLGRGAATLSGGPPPDASPELRALYAEKQAIQKRISDLRAVRASMDSTRYEKELEDLLVSLALKNREIRKAEGGGG
ncbi:MAG: hypothetical protein PVH00_02180 [Gemmatimonadota bacterium]|jgi:hypothetical protein